jgi:hypothetical protein
LIFSLKQALVEAAKSGAVFWSFLESGADWAQVGEKIG